MRTGPRRVYPGGDPRRARVGSGRVGAAQRAGYGVSTHWSTTSQLFSQVVAPPQFRLQPAVQPVIAHTSVAPPTQPTLQPSPKQSSSQEVEPVQFMLQSPPSQVPEHVEPAPQVTLQPPPGQETTQVSPSGHTQL